jgi:hypothetical protein
MQAGYSTQLKICGDAQKQITGAAFKKAYCFIPKRFTASRKDFLEMSLQKNGGCFESGSR